jgi:hypothetical protein
MGVGVRDRTVGAVERAAQQRCVAPDLQPGLDRVVELLVAELTEAMVVALRPGTRANPGVARRELPPRRSA